MEVYWLEQTAADVPSEKEWLSARELAQENSLRFPKRRADWLLGRWTAKRALAACLELPPEYSSLVKLELRSLPSGAPEVFFENRPAPITVSISHSAGMALCALALSFGALGCDLETIEPRNDAFVRDYFTGEELELVAQAAEKDRPLVSTLLWSAKESALKALQAGLRLDTRCVIVSPGNVLEEYGNHPDFSEGLADAGLDWRPMCVRYVKGQTLQGWWHHDRTMVRTLVGSPQPASPVLLIIPPLHLAR